MRGRTVLRLVGGSVSSSPSSRLTRAALSPVNLEVGGSKVEKNFKQSRETASQLDQGDEPSWLQRALGGGMEPRRSP